MLINLELSRRTKTEEVNRMNNALTGIHWQEKRSIKEPNHLQLHPQNIKKIKLSKIIFNSKEQSK